MKNQPNLSIIDDLKKASLDAFQQGHYLQSSIIIFQIVEGLLRIAIRACGKGNNIEEAVLQRAADDETSFNRLILHFNLIYPQNQLSRRLTEFNNTRNRLIHRLFIDFESMNSLEKRLKQFCMEGIELNQLLRRLLGVTDNEISKKST